MLYVFIACLTIGIAYTAVSAVFGAHGADHGGVDHGGIGHGMLDHGGTGHSGLNHSGVDASADGHDTGHANDSPSPFNPLVIACGITTFGGVGLIAKIGFVMSDLVSTAVALICSGLIGAAIFFGIVKFMYGSQSNSTFSLNDLIGSEAEVITPVPEKGVGEIAYVINGVRYNLSAKSYLNKSIPRGAVVNIRDIQGSMALVCQKVTIDQYESEITDEKKELNKEKE